MNENFFDSVDEKRRSRFETDWINGQATDLADYLPPPEDPLYLGTLHELVHIELEFRWKLSDESGQQPPRIETYIERFPQLEDKHILPGLVQAEYELRWLSAATDRDRPEVGEYVERIRVMPDVDLDVRNLLEPVRDRLVTTRPRQRDDGLSAGTQLGRYRLVAEHGRGGFGAVWRADDTKLGRRIALKRLGANLARQSESRRRFMSEARVTARLEHPGIVPVYDMSNLDDDHAWYAMKLVRGDTMADKIDAAHALPRGDSRRSVAEQNLLRSFLDVCNTIDYCHARGVVHRDIKPQNVVVGSFG
ncbi:MAG: serine/threonine-protein kinase, partial [Pirellulaceae bacterium]